MDFETAGLMVSWPMFLSIGLLAIYSVVSKTTQKLPQIPLGLLITSLILKFSARLVSEYAWSVGWTGPVIIASDVVLSWSVAHIVFWGLVQAFGRFKEDHEVLPKITRDFIMFLTFFILLIVVLRIRSNINLASLLTTSAILTVVLGLAAQATLSNFFSGLIIQAERPFAIGDWISFGEYEGRVVGISWKSTQILTRLQVLVYIPNSILASSTFCNYSKPTRQKIAQMFIGIEYGIPPNQVADVIIRTVEQDPRVMERPRPIVRVYEFGDFAITYEIRVWHRNYANEPQLKADLNKQIWYALKRNHIRIPFPIRNVQHEHIERRYAKEQDLSLQEEIKQIMGTVPVLSPLSEQEREALSKRVRIDCYGIGELIVKEGEPGESMYVIRSGSCQALKQGQGRRMKLLSTMNEGDFFGEISLLTGEKRTATIKAIQDTSLIVIEKDVFSKVIIENPKISEHLARAVIERQHKEGVALEDPTQIETTSRNLILKVKHFFGI